MKPYLYNVILGFLAFLILLVPFTGKVHDARNRWFKRLTARGWMVCIAFMLTMIVNYLKDEQAERNDLYKEKSRINEKKADESTSRKLNDESNAKTINTFTVALAKYGLKYDSTQKIIQKLIRDSSKKIVRIESAENPNIILHSIILDKTVYGTYFFKISLFCQNAPSEHINIKLSTICEVGNEYHAFNKLSNFYSNDGSMARGELFTFSVVCKTPQTPQAFYFLLNGSYKNAYSNKYKVNRIYSYDLEQKNIGVPLEPYYTEIKKFFEKNL